MKPLIRKSWYTLTEAADYLTRSTEGGPVTVSDVLQLATEGELQLTLRLFSQALATPGEIILPLREENGDLTFADILEMDLPKPCRADYVSEQRFEELTTECELIGSEDIPILFCPWSREYEPGEVSDEMLIDGGTYWRLTLHGHAKDVLQKWWRESYENEEKDWNSIEPKRFLENLGSFELWGYSYVMAGHDPIFFLTPHPDNGYAYFIKIAGSELPETTMLGVLSEDLDHLLTTREPVTSPPASGQSDPDRQHYPPQLEALPHKFQQIYMAIAGGELPDLEAAINAWYLHWHERPARGERDTYPKNPNIQAWLEDRGVSRNKAESIPPLIRPKWG